MNIRTRRLTRDYEMVSAEFANNEHVNVQVIAGDPPNHYLITYHLNGITWDQTQGTAKPITEHIVDITLPLGYPKQTPRCIMQTPVWHPNIGDYVCIGDYWSAGVTLVDIIAHIGDMIQYKSYNLRSPVNKTAALWAQNHVKSFPVGTRAIIRPSRDTNPQECILELAPPPGEPQISLGPIRTRN